jgi:hypothetical protein
MKDIQISNQRSAISGLMQVLENIKASDKESLQHYELKLDKS